MDDELGRVWIGNLHNNVSEELLYELFLQAGPVREVDLPRKDGRQKGFGFVTFKHACSASYAAQLFEGTALFGRELNVKPAKRSGAQQPDEHSLNSLRGFSGYMGMMGREDLSNVNVLNYASPMGHTREFTMNTNSSSPLMNITVPNFFSSVPDALISNGLDLNKLEDMSQQLLNFQNPYGSTMGMDGPKYPSQMADSVLSSKRDDFGRRGADRRDQRETQGHDRYVHYDRPYPRPNDRRRDDRRHADQRRDDRRYGHYKPRSHQSSSSRHRERN